MELAYPFANGRPVRVNLQGGLWIEIKEFLSHADKRAITNAAMRGLLTSEPVVTDERKVKLKLREDWQIGEDEMEMVKRCLVAWNFPGDAGSEAPINAETLLALRDNVWHEIVEAMNKQYPSMAEAEQKK